MSKTKCGAELSLRDVERLACVLVVDLHRPYVVWYWCWAKPPVNALLFTTYNVGLQEIEKQGVPHIRRRLKLYLNIQ